MYDAPGERREAVAVRELSHGDACVVDNFVGFAAKVSQPSAYTAPNDPDWATIAVDEVFTQFLVGTHEIALTGGLAGAGVGDTLWIDPDNDTVRLEADATAGDLALGVIDEIDAVRTPDVARVNMNAKSAFIVHGA